MIWMKYSNELTLSIGQKLSDNFLKNTDTYIDSFLTSEAIRFIALEMYSNLIYSGSIVKIEDLDQQTKQVLKSEARGFIGERPVSTELIVEFCKALCVFNFYLSNTCDAK